MSRVFRGQGKISIWPEKAKAGSMISDNTRFSITLNGEYVAIIEVQLPTEEYLENGKSHLVSVRILADIALDLNTDYVVRDPLHDIGLFRLQELSAV